MNIVIQCAARKHEHAGYFRTLDGRTVLFVADPRKAPSSSSYLHARPDDRSDAGISWRDRLLQYNRESVSNEFGLLRAIDLYAHPAYQRLASARNITQSYILSAGWGLIRADFLTPYYDITFSSAAESYKRRISVDNYRDLNMLPSEANEPTLFFGGKDYVPLFCELTKSVKANKIVFFNVFIKFAIKFFNIFTNFFYIPKRLKSSHSFHSNKNRI